MVIDIFIYAESGLRVKDFICVFIHISVTSYKYHIRSLTIKLFLIYYLYSLVIAEDHLTLL
ncbi:Uncharacterized protein dnm_016360 [Desulfonema magnum]|uniref:Uncharacterized protein n=1 Tax=Desulfonema magnum TaxID=45655 RepID=A0A975BHZ2_9BACT|nr:Uncharacterized protein dnm_016360 [Desulfonema magnum]